MTSINLAARGFALALALALSASLLSIQPVHAFSSEAQQMCTGDAFRLCGSDIPNVARITACMRAKRAHLSVGCRMVMDKDDAAAKSKVASVD